MAADSESRAAHLPSGEPALGAAIAEISLLVQADGGGVAVDEEVEVPGQVRLRLDLEGVSCPECLLPPDLLGDMVETIVRRHLPQVGVVEFVDPRRRNSTESSTEASSAEVVA